MNFTSRDWITLYILIYFFALIYNYYVTVNKVWIQVYYIHVDIISLP